MNKIILMGRLVRDPEIRYSQGDKPMPIARYSIAVDKKYKREDGITADFFQLVAFDKQASFAEKYLHKGVKIVMSGHVQTGYYEKNGVNMPFFEVVVQEQEFAESKAASGQTEATGQNQNPAVNRGYSVDADGFMNVPDELEDELPFN